MYEQLIRAKYKILIEEHLEKEFSLRIFYSMNDILLI